MNLRDKILGANPQGAFEDEEVPEWGVTVRLRELSGDERADLEEWWAATPDGDRKRRFRAVLLVKTLVDPETGEHILTDEDVDGLLRQPDSLLDRLWAKAANMSGLRKQDVEAAEGN